MTVIIILLGASLIVALFFLASYIWSTQAGQFDDLYSPGERILFEEDNNQIEK